MTASDPDVTGGRRRIGRREELAARAARLFVDRRVRTVEEAIAAVGADVVSPDGMRGVTPGRVRQHIEATEMARRGAAGVESARRQILEIAEELMTLLETALDPARTLLVGRAAAGRLDGEVTLHVRVYSTASIGEIAALVVAAGHEEPRFRTAQTRHGRLDRIEFSDGGVGVAITRCVPSVHLAATSRAQSATKATGKSGASVTDLHTGKPIAALNLDGVRGKLQK